MITSHYEIVFSSNGFKKFVKLLVNSVFWVLILFSIQSHSQQIHHYTLTSSGSNVQMINNYFINQSIGQVGIIGNYSNKSVVVFQGFQQGILDEFIVEKINNYEVQVYPNPFSIDLNLAIAESNISDISIGVYDLSGKQVHIESHNKLNNPIKLKLNHLSAAVYYLIVQTPKMTYNAKIIKK